MKDTTINNALRTTGSVLATPPYAIVAIVTAVVILLFAIWLPNISLITNTVVSTTLSLAEKARLLFDSLAALQSNFTPLSRTLTIAVAILFGINISVLVYYLRRRFRLERSAGTSVVGMISGLLGVGCAACGSVILSALFGVGATASFIGVLPLKGQEFGIIGVLFLAVSIIITARKINQPLTCSI